MQCAQRVLLHSNRRTVKRTAMAGSGKACRGCIAYDQGSGLAALALAIRSGALDYAKLFEIPIGDPRNLFHMLVPGGQATLLFTASPQKLLDAPVSLCAYK